MLLDTQALLWFLLDDSRLSRKALEVIATPSNEILVSPASHWEVAIKISIGKYVLEEAFESFFIRHLQSNKLTILPIEPRHTARLTDLPYHHRDPFDRLIITQALAEAIPLVSSDRQFDAYAVNRIW